MVGIAALPLESKIKLSVQDAARKLPGEVGNELGKLVEPEALAVMVSVLTVWGLAHLLGVGFAADIVLLVVGAAALGGVAIQAGNEVAQFVSRTTTAKTDEDIDAAGTHLSRAISLIGVQAVLAILLKKRPTTFPGQSYRYSGGPRVPGTLVYRPTIKRGPSQSGEMGYTSEWGDIHITSTMSSSEKRATLYHELVHSVLTPKLYALRNLRVTISQNGYAKSHLLRYVEEALCETYALIRMNGFSLKSLVEGIRFPIRGQYTTIAAMGKEAVGILLGPINVGGMTYNVYYASSRP
jgi:hypothetical protein